MKQFAKDGYFLRLFRNAAARRKTRSEPDNTAELHRRAAVASDTQPFVIDRPSVPLLGSRAGSLHPQVQSGVLAWRRGEDGIEILLVRKLRSGTWGIPKGKVKRGLSSAENAAKEAFEEAGIRGQVEQRAVGTYRAIKRQMDLRIVIEVSVHLLEVTETARDWPEKQKRDVKWCSPEQAVKLLNEPMLIELCKGLEDN